MVSQAQPQQEVLCLLGLVGSTGQARDLAALRVLGSGPGSGGIPGLGACSHLSYSVSGPAGFVARHQDPAHLSARQLSDGP